MQNGGLPEAGDAVLTFPPAALADRDAYARASAIPGAGADPAAREAAAQARRDLAVEGFGELCERVEREGPAALEAHDDPRGLGMCGRLATVDLATAGLPAVAGTHVPQS